MRIAVVSDIHDHVWNLAAALERLRSDADALLCCGDLCSPFVLAQLGDGFPGPVHVVFGNNDGDLWRIATQAASRANVTLHGEAFADELGGLRVGMSHYPALARRFDRRRYDLICFGHDHRYAVETDPDGALLVNPGPLMGYSPLDGSDVTPTFVVVDAAARTTRRYELRIGGSGREAHPADPA